MMLLDRHGFKPDPFVRVAGNDLAGTSHALVTLAELDAALANRSGNHQIGVEIANTTRPEALAPHHTALALIAIAFPAFSDGRGFSLARQLRAAGFTGDLRAVGPLISDQFAYALACGFDEIELPEASAARQPAAQWEAALRVISLPYQRGYARSETILDRRRAARKAGGPHD